MPTDESRETDETHETEEPRESAAEKKPVEAYDVEAAPPPKDAPRLADLKCPNCGAERDDEHELLCLRCGYNMVTLKVEKTKTGDAEVVPEEGEDGEPREAPPGITPKNRSAGQ